MGSDPLDCKIQSRKVPKFSHVSSQKSCCARISPISAVFAALPCQSVPSNIAAMLVASVGQAAAAPSRRPSSVRALGSFCPQPLLQRATAAQVRTPVATNAFGPVTGHVFATTLHGDHRLNESRCSTCAVAHPSPAASTFDGPPQPGGGGCRRGYRAQHRI